MTRAPLIDGENLSSAHAPALLRAVPAPCPVRRVYGDVARLNGWLAVADLRPVHAAPGRNSADILLAVEAMELFHRSGLRVFALATSDGGLAHLATHLREAGAEVTVLAEAKAGEALRSAGTRFVELVAVASATKASPSPLPSARQAAAAGPDLVAFVTERLQAAGREGVRVADLDPLVRRALGITIGTRPERTWRAWLTADCRKARFDLDPRGPAARVRLAAPPS
jgi:hypothetical protein